MGFKENSAFLIDSSCFWMLIKYYLPFDANDKLRNFLEDRFEQEEIVLLGKVWQEIENKQNINDALPFLAQTDAVPVRTAPLPLIEKARKKWAGSRARDNMPPKEFDKYVDRYIKSADFHLIALCWEQKHQKPDELLSIPDAPLIIVTEESNIQWNNKAFRKIPIICRDEGIECINLAQMLQRLGVDVEFKLPSQ